MMNNYFLWILSPASGNRAVKHGVKLYRDIQLATLSTFIYKYWSVLSLYFSLFSHSRAIHIFTQLEGQGPVVRMPISANPGLNFNQGFFFFSSKALSQMIFYIFLEYPIIKL